MKPSVIFALLPLLQAAARPAPQQPETRPSQPPARELRSAAFDAASEPVHFLDTGGEGEVVLLIRGLYARAAVNWVRPGIPDHLARAHRVVVIAGAGHLDCVTKPAFREEIARWLARQAPAGDPEGPPQAAEDGS